MAVDLDGVAPGLVEDVDHLFVAEKHLPMDARWDQLGVTHHHGTDECITSQDKSPGFVSDRLERTGHGKIRGMESKGPSGRRRTRASAVPNQTA